jgi:hypothetical protein
MKKFFLILMVLGLVFSSCSKEEKSSNMSETSVSSPEIDRNGATLLVYGGGGSQQSLTCGWSDGYGSGQVACAGTHCALSSYSSGGSTYTGITCFNNDVPLHTDNYRPD